MLSIDLALFYAVNADAATAPAVIAMARGVSQWLPFAAGAILAALLATGSPQQRHAVLLGLVAMLLAWVGVHVLRVWMPAPRPAQLGLGMQWLEHAARTGFPSMHAAGAFALAAGLSLGRMPRLAAVAWIMAATMAWSRVCLGVHFPSDVLAGALTGVVGAVVANGLWIASRKINWRGRFSAYWFHRGPPWARHK